MKGSNIIELLVLFIKVNLLTKSMVKQSIMVDLDDPRTAKIAEVLSNKTSKIILSSLAEREKSAKDLADELKLPLNTIGYNLQKLVDCGLIEKSKSYFWSAKGKKIVTYKVSNKRIVISPVSKIKGLMASFLLIAAITLALYLYSFNNLGYSDYGAGSNDAEIVSLKSVAFDTNADRGIYETLYNAPNSWAWYLLGGMTVVAVISILNYLKVKGGNDE
jgi:DNA-binding transcriptional ArsR family regulator